MHNLLNQKELKKIEFNDTFLLKILTTKQDLYQVSGFLNYKTENPYFFIAGQFLIYLFDTDKQAEEKFKSFFYKNNPILNFDKNNFKVVYIDKDLYDNVINKQWEIYLKKMDSQTKMNFLGLINEKLEIINKINAQKED